MINNTNKSNPQLHNIRQASKKSKLTRHRKGVLQKKYGFIFTILIVLIIIVSFDTILFFIFRKPQNKKKSIGQVSEFYNCQKLTNSVPAKTDDAFFFIRGEIGLSYTLPFGIINFKDNNKQETKRVLIDTGSFQTVLKSELTLQELSEDEIVEVLSGQSLTQTECPSPYEERLCNVQSYMSVSFITLIGLLHFVDNKASEQHSFPVVLQKILSFNGSYRSIVLNNESLSALGVGFMNGNFRSNGFFDGVLTHLDTVHKKKVPRVFSMVFHGNGFSAFIGKEVDESSFVSVKLPKNKFYNVFEVRSLFVNETKVNKAKTFFFFDTGSTAICLSPVYFDAFMEALKKGVPSERRTELKFEEESLGSDKKVVVTATKDVVENVTVVLELENAKMVLPLASLIYIKDGENRKGTFYSSRKTWYSFFNFKAVRTCFDFFMDGDKNIIGFKKTESANKQCFVGYVQV